MEIIGIIILFFIALLVGALFTYGFKTRTPWGAFWAFLLLLFLAALAGRYWIQPVGPQLYGVAWAPVLFFVFIIALLIAASAPADDYATPKEPVDPELREPEVRGTVAVFGLFFWLLLLFFLIAIIVGMAQLW
ncbi:MAG: hypothetical protein ACQEWG_01120 [Bacteroidota bacterium]